VGDVLNRFAQTLVGRLSRPAPDFTIRRVDHSSTQDLERAEAWMRQEEGMGLHLLNPAHPGDATYHERSDFAVIEWQSANRWQPGQAQTIAFLVTMPRDRRALVNMKLSVPGMTPVHRRIEITWSGPEPLVQIVTPL
jgi:hypothetical protein